MKSRSISIIQKTENLHAIKRLTILLSELQQQAEEIDQLNQKQKYHWLIENNDIFSPQLFKTQSDRFTPYVKESKQRLIELTHLIKTTLINANKETIAKELLTLIEQQISALMNAFQSNETMHHAAKLSFETKRKVRTNIVKKAQVNSADQYQKIAKTILLNSHQLHHKLLEHHEFERRLLEMITTKSQQLNQNKFISNEKTSQELLALHQRLGRCRKAISVIERDIELAKKRL